MAGCGQEEWDGITADASAASLHPFATGAIEPDSTVIADAWQGYSGLEGLGYTREPRSPRPLSGEMGGKILGVDLMPGLPPLVLIKGLYVHRDSGIAIYG